MQVGRRGAEHVALLPGRASPQPHRLRGACGPAWALGRCRVGRLNSTLSYTLLQQHAASHPAQSRTLLHADPSNKSAAWLPHMHAHAQQHESPRGWLHALMLLHGSRLWQGYPTGCISGHVGGPGVRPHACSDRSATGASIMATCSICSCLQ